MKKYCIHCKFVGICGFTKDFTYWNNNKDFCSKFEEPKDDNEIEKLEGFIGINIIKGVEITDKEYIIKMAIKIDKIIDKHNSIPKENKGD